MIEKTYNILILGLGLIGGSYAEGLSKAGYKVYAITKDQSSIDYAKKKGFIKEGYDYVNKELLNEIDILICAIYPSLILPWMKENQIYLKKGAIITDVTGVKSIIVGPIQEILREDLEFIGAHPMAGRELSGVENANAAIFKGANYIITPTKKNTKRGIDVAKSIGEILEFKNISVLSVEEHDEMIGFLSQLTHCIAVSLMTCKESKHLVEYTGDSFRDLTRIARINESMWTELFLANRLELIAQMDLFLKQFTILRNAIENGDEETMKEMMKLSTYNRSFFDKK